MADARPTDAPPDDAPAAPSDAPSGPPPAWIPGPPGGGRREGRDRRSILITLGLGGLMAVVALLAILSAAPGPRPGPEPDRVGARPADVDVVIASGPPVSWDPARIGDATSAAVLAQVWDGLTTLDANGTVQPALADSWEVQQEGRRVVFRLRPGVAFSDGTPIRSQDVVDSWLRTIDPADPSPLAWLLGDVVGARELLDGTGDRDGVGLRAEGDRIVVDLRRPAAYLPALIASPTLAVVPPSMGDRARGPAVPDGLVVSGAYVPSEAGPDAVRLDANPHAWSGAPGLQSVGLLTDTGGRSPVEVFQSGDADHVTLSGDDATWLAWDPDLGPQLRRTDDLSVRFYGFDTTQPPFDDPRIRRAVAMAVDWERLVLLDDASAVVATSLVPAGIPLRGAADVSPIHDAEAARAELAAAGYAGGVGLPPITLVTPGGSLDVAVARELERELGMTVTVEVMPFDDYNDRLDTDPPQMYSLDWLADYPHPQDFLGLLLETGSGSNVGGWSSAAFDAALEAAASTTDPLAQERAYEEAGRIVQEEAPLIPLRYGETWALSRDGLLGAGSSGMGMLRFASLAWEQP